MRMALDIGLRHIDTAQMYGNERDVGPRHRAPAACRAATLCRHQGRPGNVGSGALRSTRVARSVDDLGGPADLLLIHWPPAEDDFDGALDRLMAEQEKGNARAIGVSNFTPAMMRRAQKRCGGRHRQQPGGVPSAARPDGSSRHGARARHHALGLFAACPRCGAEAAVIADIAAPHRAPAVGSGPALDHPAGRRRHPDDHKARECPVQHLRARL